MYMNWYTFGKPASTIKLKIHTSFSARNPIPRTLCHRNKVLAHKRKTVQKREQKQMKDFCKFFRKVKEVKKHELNE